MLRKNLDSLKDTHPDIAKEAFGWDPTSVSAGSEKKREWKCGQDHQWKANVNSRTRGRI